MAISTDMLWYVLQWSTLNTRLSILAVDSRRGLVDGGWASIGEGWFENKRLPDISRKCFSQGIDLLLHIRHGPGTSASL